MSRIGRKPVPLPAGVKVEVADRTVNVAGPKGRLSWTVPAPIRVGVEGGQVVVGCEGADKSARALHGLTRALIANMVRGVHEAYEIRMEIYGTGYSVRTQGRQLLLNLGYMGLGVGRPAQFVLDIPEGLQVDVEVQAARGENEPARFVIRGIDKQLVGQFAAEIRKLRKPEPYKGKGVRYAGEQIRRKAGKVFASGGAG